MTTEKNYDNFWSVVTIVTSMATLLTLAKQNIANAIKASKNKEAVVVKKVTFGYFCTKAWLFLVPR